MSHAPTVSRLSGILAFQYDEVTLPCTEATWQLGGSEHAYWPIDEAYPEATQFRYNGVMYQIMRDLPEGEHAVTIRILVDSFRNAALLMFRKRPQFLFVYHLDEWQAVSAQVRQS